MLVAMILHAGGRSPDESGSATKSQDEGKARESDDWGRGKKADIKEAALEAGWLGLRGD